MPYTPDSLKNSTSLEHWQSRLEFLERDFPDHLDDIAYAKLKILEHQNPEQADHYNKLAQDLTRAINTAWDEDPEDFGFDDAQEVTQKFLIKHDLSDWLEDEVAATDQNKRDN